MLGAQDKHRIERVEPGDKLRQSCFRAHTLGDRLPRVSPESELREPGNCQHFVAPTGSEFVQWVGEERGARILPGQAHSLLSGSALPFPAC